MSKLNKAVSIGGVFCGNRLAPKLFAEEIASHRYVIRHLASPDYTKRVGEVMGKQGCYQAMRMNGDHVAICSSLADAAKRLI